MSALRASIHFEAQEPGSMLCGVHALNNLLQAALFSPQDLAQLAQELDDLEDAQLSHARVGPSANFDETGYFSVGVMEQALAVMGLKMVRWGAQEMADVHDRPEEQEAFILNHDVHWYTIRRFHSQDHFYNLDSCREPEHVSPMYLGLTLREAEIQGYSIFAIVPVPGSNATGLPPCPADELARTLLPPNAYNLNSSFWGAGHTLGSASTSGAKRTAGSDEESAGEYSDQSEQRRLRPRLGDADLTEEEQMSLAIEASLNLAQSDDETPQTIEVDSDDEEVQIIESSSSRVSARAPARSNTASTVQAPPTASTGKSRAAQEEEDQLAAAIAASLDIMGSGAEGKGKERAVESEEEEEGDDAPDDEPSVEELRRRRLARFG